MSHIVSCDGGCGFTSSKDSDFEMLGVIFQKEYCEKCREEIKAYLIAKDNLHDKLAAQWSKETDKLKVYYKKLQPNGELPDE